MEFNLNFSKRKIGAIIILLMLPTYVVMVSALPANISSQCDPQLNPQRGVTDQVGVCTEVSATVIRQYYFGTLRLPVEVLGLNIDLLNRVFIPLSLISSAVLWSEKSF